MNLSHTLGCAARIIINIGLKRMKASAIHFATIYYTVITTEPDWTDQDTRRKRLLIVLFALGTNTGLKRISGSTSGPETYDNLRQPAPPEAEVYQQGQSQEYQYGRRKRDT